MEKRCTNKSMINSRYGKKNRKFEKLTNLRHISNKNTF